jgi:hypothetical protein
VNHECDEADFLYVFSDPSFDVLMGEGLRFSANFFLRLKLHCLTKNMKVKKNVLFLDNITGLLYFLHGTPGVIFLHVVLKFSLI